MCNGAAAIVTERISPAVLHWNDTNLSEEYGYGEETNFEMPNDMTKMAYGGFAVAVEG